VRERSEVTRHVPRMHVIHLQGCTLVRVVRAIGGLDRAVCFVCSFAGDSSLDCPRRSEMMGSFFIPPFTCLRSSSSILIPLVKNEESTKWSQTSIFEHNVLAVWKFEVYHSLPILPCSCSEFRTASSSSYLVSGYLAPTSSLRHV